MKKKDIKYIVVTGGVLSGLGKGIVNASIGNLLVNQGYKVTAVKIDPYINLDAGTMRPTEHGEVWVTDDGGETDQDLGNYERFLNTNIPKGNNITTGQVYLEVINKERNLEYHGKCVEVIPHIPQEVERRIIKAGKEAEADFVMVEIGGTIGDYQNILFLETVREMKRRRNNVVFVHVAYLPIPNHIGEMKTKPAQHSVRQLNANGIQPDFIIGRSKLPLDDVRKEKIALFCNVKKDAVLSAPNIDNIYRIPVNFEKQQFVHNILKKFGMKYKKTKKSRAWQDYINKISRIKKELKIGIVGKYFDIGNFSLEDSYVSIIEAVKHAAWRNNRKPVIEWINSKKYECDPALIKELENYDGIIIPGGFGSSGIDGKLLAIKYIRENNIPFLGLCLGMQLAVVEFARNVCGLKNAHTTEVSPDTDNPVIDILPEQKDNLRKKNYGATMRLGSYPAKLKKESLVCRLYGNKTIISERHRHRYEVNPEYALLLEQCGLKFSGVSPDRKLMEFLELPDHNFFVATQAHPEFKSRLMKPAPLFDGFVKAAAKGRGKSQ